MSLVFERDLNTSTAENWRDMRLAGTEKTNIEQASPNDEGAG